MYATTTMNHRRMTEDLDDPKDGQYVTTSINGVAVHFGDGYLSFTADEAERLGSALIRNAAKLRAEEALKAAAEAEAVVAEAPVRPEPEGFFNGDDITLIS